MTVREYNKFPCCGMSDSWLIVKFDGSGVVIKQGNSVFSIGYNCNCWILSRFNLIKVPKLIKYNKW